jgi:hypothetical protein
MMNGIQNSFIDEVLHVVFGVAQGQGPNNIVNQLSVLLHQANALDF